MRFSSVLLLVVYCFLQNLSPALLMMFRTVRSMNYKDLCNGHTGKKYAVVLQRVAALDALVHCRQNNMNLATIRSHEENMEVIKEAHGMDFNAWIGLTRFGSSIVKEDFCWFADGSEVNYTNWGTSARGAIQPDNYGGLENCVYTSFFKSLKLLPSGPGSWFDVYCQGPYSIPFICEAYCGDSSENRTKR